MIRLKNRINQVVVGADYENPIECEITHVYRDRGEDFGKVRLNGKQYRVKALGGGVWILAKGVKTSDLVGVQQQKGVA